MRLSVVAGAGAFSLSCVVCGRHRRGGRGYFITQFKINIKDIKGIDYK